MTHNYLRHVIDTLQGSLCYIEVSAVQESSFFMLKKRRYLFALKQPSRCERIQKTSCVMEAGSHTIFLCALFIFSAEGKVYKHLIVRSHFAYAYMC